MRCKLHFRGMASRSYHDEGGVICVGGASGGVDVLTTNSRHTNINRNIKGCGLNTGAGLLFCGVGSNERRGG